MPHSAPRPLRFRRRRFHKPLLRPADYHSFIDGRLHDLAHQSFPAPEPGPGARPIITSGRPWIATRRLTGSLSGFCDDARTEQALLYLRELRDRTKPFFLHVNLSKPHPGYEVEEPYFSMYDPATVTPWPHALPRNAPLPLRVMREVRAGGGLPEEALRDVQAVYYGMVTKVESLIGRILDELRTQHLEDNTAILFTSDHGDFAGQYGLYEKWDTCMADCILRVPAILKAPGLPAGRRHEGLSSHIDLVPTLLGALGLTPDWGVHGQSLLPRVASGAGARHVFAGGGHEQEMWGRFNFSGKPGRELDGKQRTYLDHPETMARTKMVRSDRWKLAARLAGGNELYDLAADPHELDNLWPDLGTRPDLLPVVADLQQALIEWSLRTDTDRPFQEHVGA